MNHFEELAAWQDSRELAVLVYAALNADAFANDDPLRSGMREAANQIMHPIAESFDAISAAECIELLRTSRQHCNRLQSQLQLARDLNHLDDETFQKLYRQSIRVRKSTHHLIRECQ